MSDKVRKPKGTESEDITKRAVEIYQEILSSGYMQDEYSMMITYNAVVDVLAALSFSLGVDEEAAAYALKHQIDALQKVASMGPKPVPNNSLN